MAIDYSYLSEVFPGYNDRDAPSTYEVFFGSSPPAYSTPSEKILDLQANQKLRIVNDKLEIDTRKFQSIYRKYTGDSRWKILEKIVEIKNVNIREFYLDILRSSTYSGDKKWIEASRKKF